MKVKNGKRICVRVRSLSGNNGKVSNNDPWLAVCCVLSTCTAVI